MNTLADTAAESLPPPTTLHPDLMGHPRGLPVLAATELWDRISFHGMQALLTLYMANQLLLPGHIEHVAGFASFRAAIEAVTGPLSTKALATQIFGLYVGFVYFTPVFGGWLGDRLLGRSRTVILGGLLMAAGHFCMAFDASFLLALLFLILGAGTFRGNLAPQVGELYAKDDRRRAIAFQLYGAMINLGAFIAPLVTGALGKAYGWHVGFAFAGFGMLLGLIIYIAGQRYIPAHARGLGQAGSGAAARPPITAADRPAILLLLALIPVAALFWVAQSQIWNTYNLWAQDHINLTILGWTMPVPWLQSLDGLAPFISLPVALWIWAAQARRGREPDEFGKAAIGCFIFAASTLLLAGAHLLDNAQGRAPLLLAVAFHLSSNFGWLYFAPTMLALFTRGAPASVNATLVGAYYLSTFIGSLVSGRLGGLYETWTPQAFWLLHAAAVALGGLLLLLIGGRFGRVLAGAKS